MISRISLPHTPIKRTRRISLAAVIPQFTFERTSVAFAAATPLPALVTAKRSGATFLARVDKTRDFNGHLFVRVQYGNGEVQWTNAANIVEVV